MINRSTFHIMLMVSIVFLSSTLFFAFLFGRVHMYAFWMGGVITFLFVHYWHRRVGQRVRRAVQQTHTILKDKVAKIDPGNNE